MKLRDFLRKATKRAVKKRANAFIDVLVLAGIAERKIKKHNGDKIDS